MGQQIAQEGTHRVWVGVTDARGRPIINDGQQRSQVHRPAWMTYWDMDISQLPEKRRLRKACDIPKCITARHWGLMHPKGVYKAAGMRKKQVRDLRHRFRSTGLLGALPGLWWDVRQIEHHDFGLPRHMLAALSKALGYSQLVILAMWSEQMWKRKDTGDL